MSGVAAGDLRGGPVGDVSVGAALNCEGRKRKAATESATNDMLFAQHADLTLFTHRHKAG